MLNSVSSTKVFELYGVDNVEIIILESYPCNSKDELYMRERHYFETIDCVNLVIPIRTADEKISMKLENDRVYRENNRELIKRVKHTCKCGAIYRRCDKKVHNNTNKHKRYKESVD